MGGGGHLRLEEKLKKKKNFTKIKKQTEKNKGTGNVLTGHLQDIY